MLPNVLPPTSGSLAKPGSGLTRPPRVTDMGHAHRWPRSSWISGASQVCQFPCAMQCEHEYGGSGRDYVSVTLHQQAENVRARKHLGDLLDAPDALRGARLMVDGVALVHNAAQVLVPEGHAEPMNLRSVSASSTRISMAEGPHT